MGFFRKLFNKKNDRHNVFEVKIRKQFSDYLRPLFFLLLFIYAAITLTHGLLSQDPSNGWEYFDSALDKVSEKNIDKSIPSVGLITLSGIIQSKDPRTPFFARKNDVITPKYVRDEIKRYLKRDDIDALIFIINSPGGTVVAADAIARIISQTSQKIPVYVYTEEVLASGGYYISAPAKRIFAAPQAQVGSIGVIYQSVNYEKLAKDHLGVDVKTFKHGKYKDIGNPMREMNPAEIKIMQAKIDEAYQSFENIILTHRDIDNVNMEDISTGLTFSGVVAKSKGLVDDVVYLDQLSNKIAKDMGKKSIYFVERFSGLNRGIFRQILTSVNNFWSPITQFVGNMNINHTGLLYLHQF